MPAILDRLVKQLKDKGKDTSTAFAIATSVLQKSGNLKKGTQKATSKGKKRGSMSPKERSNDRAARRSKHKPSDYSYNPKTNRSKLKKAK